jgi:hypothetical protein
MTHFRAFEVKALRLLGNATLGAVAVEAVCRDAEFVSYKYSGVGYFLTFAIICCPRRAWFSTSR